VNPHRYSLDEEICEEGGQAAKKEEDVRNMVLGIRVMHDSEEEEDEQLGIKENDDDEESSLSEDESSMSDEEDTENDRLRIN
jgi:hypothetical protein